MDYPAFKFHLEKTTMSSLLLVMLLFPWIRVYADQCRNAYSQKNLKLQGHMIKSLSRSESPQCVDECSLHGKCHSINFDHGKGICELNDANHLSNPESLVYSHGSQYLNYHKRPVAKCSNKLCSEPLMCKMLDDGLNYKCVAKPEVLNFPRKSTEDKVVLENAFNSLTAFTVALWVQVDLRSSYNTPFSYATKSGSSNEILLFLKRPSVVGLQRKSFECENISESNSIVDGKWHHLCITWENAQGKLKVYIDGVLVKSVDAVNTGHVISKGAIVLGQDQDSYKGGFQIQDSLSGNLTSVNMWDKVLAAQEISVLAKSCTEEEGNLVKWSDLKDKGEGAVKLIRTSACGPGL